MDKLDSDLLPDPSPFSSTPISISLPLAHPYGPPVTEADFLDERVGVGELLVAEGVDVFVFLLSRLGRNSDVVNAGS
jgi:hypothetical protein